MKILVAEIIASHGIKGEFKIKSFSNNEDRFKEGSILYLDDKKVKVQSSFRKKNNLILKLEEFNDINEIEKLIGHELTIEEEDLPELNKKDEFYFFELEGLSVYENGKKKGVIKEIISGVYPNDVYVVDTGKGEVLLPALNATIVNIDLENKKIEVKDFEDYE